jgi:hypothetical protein
MILPMWVLLPRLTAPRPWRALGGQLRGQFWGRRKSGFGPSLAKRPQSPQSHPERLFRQSGYVYRGWPPRGRGGPLEADCGANFGGDGSRDLAHLRPNGPRGPQSDFFAKVGTFTAAHGPEAVAGPWRPIAGPLWGRRKSGFGPQLAKRAQSPPER